MKKHLAGLFVGTALTLAAVIIALVAGLAASLTQYVRAEGQRREAERLGTQADAQRTVAERAAREADAQRSAALTATGEQVAATLTAMAIQHAGATARSLLGHQIKIQTDSAYTKARIKAISGAKIFDTLRQGQIAVVAGF